MANQRKPRSWRVVLAMAATAILGAGCGAPQPKPDETPAPPPPSAPAPPPAAPTPPPPPTAQEKQQAQKLALEGLDQLQGGNESAAGATLAQALKLDPQNELARKLVDQINADAQRELGSTFFRYTVRPGIRSRSSPRRT